MITPMGHHIYVLHLTQIALRSAELKQPLFPLRLNGLSCILEIYNYYSTNHPQPSIRDH
jgi:hypothetical protein